jgi:RHS repeat-associated protein
MPQLTVLEGRRAPGSVLAWFHRLDDTEHQPAVVQEPPPPSDYSQRDLAWASSSKGSAFDLAAAVQQTDSKEDASSDTADQSVPRMDFRLASFALGAPDLLDDLTQPPWRSRGLALAGATGAMSSGDGGGAAAPALAGQGAAALGIPAGAFGGGSDNSQLLSLLAQNGTANLQSATAPTATNSTPAFSVPGGAGAVHAPAGVPPITPPARLPHVSAPPVTNLTPSGQGPSKGDPLYVLDFNNGLTLPTNVTLNNFANWPVDLLAQTSGVTVSSYTWNVSQAPDLLHVSGTLTANLQGTWNNYSGPARSDKITLTETPTAGSPITQTYNFQVAGNPGMTPPTSSTTYASFITPDLLVADQATVAAGPDAALGLADGSAQTSFLMPSYNPNVDPLELDYTSTAANAQPIFLVHYQLPSSNLPSNVTAQLTFNGAAVATVTYNPSSLNTNDYMQIALQANATGLATGRYPWQISVNNGTSTTSYSGNVDIVNQASSPFGAGWSLGNVQQIVAVTGGVILVQPGGTSLWFASAGGNNYTTPAGDFSTLVKNTNGTYTRTMPDGTKINFNSSGLQTSIVDTDGNTTSFGYNASNLLTAVTDFNGQLVTLAYNTSNQLTKVTDPAGRNATMAYDTSGNFTSITDPLSEVWQYNYDSSHDLTQLTDPRNNATTFAYDFAHRVTTVTQADSTTEKLTFEQLNGLAATGSSNVTAVLLATGAQALFTDPRNNVWTSQLDWLGFGLDSSDIDPLSDPTLIYRDTNGMPWLTADPLGRATRQTFDNLGNATLVVAPDGSSQAYQYNGFSEVTQYTNQDNSLFTYNYNANGDLTQTIDPLNDVVTATYNSHGLLTSSTDALGATTTVGLDSLNRVTKVTDALGHVTSINYDTASDVTQTTDARGFVNTFAFDAMGDLTSETLAVTSSTSATYSFSFDKVGNLTSETDPLGHSTTYGFDKLDRLSSLTDALNHQTTLGYDAAGNLTAVTDPLGRQTTAGYDTADRLTSITDPAGDQTTYGLDAAGQMTLRTDPLGRPTQYSYNLRGQLQQVLYPTASGGGGGGGTPSPAGPTKFGLEIDYSYEQGCGCLQSVTLVPLGGNITQGSPGTGPGSPTTPLTWTFRDDALDRNTSITDPLNKTTSWGFDANNNLTEWTDPLNNQTTYGFDKLNELTSITDPLGDQTTGAYDPVGNLTSVTDPLGRNTTASYDALGKLLSVTDPRGAQTTFGYDLTGNLTALTDPVGNLTSYSFNAVNLVTKMTDPLGNSSTYAYDAANELTSTTDRNGRTINFSFDLASRLTGETWVGGSYTATYTYDKDSELTKAQDPFSTYSLAYDSLGNLTTVSNAGTPGMPTVTLNYGYDQFFDRTSLSDSLGGSITYGYDNDLRLTSLGLSVGSTLEAQVTLGYDAASRLTGTTATSNGSTTTITQSLVYDNADRLTNQTYTAKTGTQTVTLANYTYGYDKASQLTSYQDANSNMTYGYDQSGQLTAATGTLAGLSWTASYAFDLNGNRTSSTINSSTTTYTNGTGNELKSDGTYSYAYDNEGNLTAQTQIATGTVTYYSYDYHNQLVEAKVQSSTGLVLNDEKCTYDVFGNRIGISLNGSQQLWTMYDGANPYIDFNGSGQVTERYLTDPRGINDLYARVSPSGTVNWYVTDNLGSVRQIVNASGTMVYQATYDPWGNLVSEMFPGNGDRFKFAAGAFDSITGSYQFGARYYSPADGRFESRDPLGFGGGTANLYGYVGNDPLDNVDPTGLHYGEGVREAARDLDSELNSFRKANWDALAAGAQSNPQSADALRSVLENILARIALRKQYAGQGGGPAPPWLADLEQKVSGLLDQINKTYPKSARPRPQGQSGPSTGPIRVSARDQIASARARVEEAVKQVQANDCDKNRRELEEALDNFHSLGSSLGAKPGQSPEHSPHLPGEEGANLRDWQRQWEQLQKEWGGWLGGGPGPQAPKGGPKQMPPHKELRPPRPPGR